MKLNLIKLNIPINFNLTIIKKFEKNHIILKNAEFNFKIIVKKHNNIKINKYINSIEYKNFYLKKNYFLLKNNFFNFLSKINNYYFYKIKFKGKGYKLGFYKKKKTINFFFGKSHKSVFVYKNIYIKKINKYKFILLNNNISTLKKISVNVINIKKINFYTGRGLRLSKQIILKRKGKKGSFV